MAISSVGNAHAYRVIADDFRSAPLAQTWQQSLLSQVSADEASATPPDPAKSLNLSDAQKKALRQNAEQQEINGTLRELAQEWLAQPGGRRQALWAGIKARDADGKVVKLLVRIDPQGNYTVQKVDDWKKTEALDEAVDTAAGTLRSEQPFNPGKTLRQAIKVDGQGYLVSLTPSGTVQTQKTDHPADTAAIDDAAAALQTQWAATPASERKKLTEKIKTPSGAKYDVMVDTSGKVTASKEGGFWGSFLHVLEDIVTPVVDVASAFVPALVPVAIGLSAEKGVHNMVDGNYVGGALMMAGTVGNLVGGAAGDIIGEAVTVGKGIDGAVTAAQQGNIFAALSGTTGVLPDTVGLFGGSSDLLAASQSWADVGAAAKLAQTGEAAWSAAATGNIFAGISGFAGILPGAADLIGGGGVADAVESVTAKVIAASELGQATENVVTAAERGNLLGAVASGLDAAPLSADVMDQITGA